MHQLQSKLKQHFPYLNDMEINRIATNGKIIRLQPGEVWRYAHADINATVLVLTGIMRNYIKVSLKEDVTVTFAMPSQFILHCPSLLLNRHANEITQAVTESIIFFIDAENFKYSLSNSEVFHMVTTDILKYSLKCSSERIQEFTVFSPEERYMRLLNNSGALLNKIPLKYVASYLGITQVSLSRIRKRITQKNKAIAA